MNRSIRTRSFVAAALAFGAIGAATAAHARTDVYFSLGVPAYVEPAPVYVQPQPVYQYDVQPAPVYVPPPAPVYNYSYDNERAWRRAEWRREHWRREHWRHEQWEREHGDRRWVHRDWD